MPNVLLAKKLYFLVQTTIASTLSERVFIHLLRCMLHRSAILQRKKMITQLQKCTGHVLLCTNICLKKRKRSLKIFWLHSAINLWRCVGFTVEITSFTLPNIVMYLTQIHFALYNQKCIFFTLNMYQATFISEILWCFSRNGASFQTHAQTPARMDPHGWKDRQTWKLK